MAYYRKRRRYKRYKGRRFGTKGLFRIRPRSSVFSNRGLSRLNKSVFTRRGLKRLNKRIMRRRII